MKFLKCIFGHKWKLGKWENYLDTSYGGEVQSFTVLKYCEICKKTKQDVHYSEGHVTQEFINKLFE